MDTYYIVSAGVLGLIFGSFATVVSYRLPRGESIATGRSKCPNCGRQISALGNVPVLSWIALRGKCHNCGEPISMRYPLTELVTGLLFAASVAKFDASVAAAVYAGFFWALVVLTVIDLEHHLLPNKIVYPTFVAGAIGLTIAAAVDNDLDRMVDAGIGALIFGGFFFLVAFIYPAGMGGGDVKLAFVLGSFLGYVDAPGVVLIGMFLSFTLGGVGGIATLIFKGGDRKTQVPFGPFLAAGSVIAIFTGERILDIYLRSF